MMTSSSDVSIAISSGKPSHKNGYGALNGSDEDEWDYVMVFPNPPKTDVDPMYQRDNIIMKLRAVGLETKLFYSVGRELVFCKLRCPEERLKTEAETMKLRMQLDPIELKRAADRGLPGYGIKPFPLVDVKHMLPYGPYDYIYAPYTKAEEAQRFFPAKGLNGSIFGSTDRMMLIENIITNHINGACCDLEKMLYEGIIVECYPLHNESAKLDLKEKWIQWNKTPMQQPFEEIWNYFGVKVSLYFLFLGHCTYWLTMPAVVGLVVELLNWTVTGSANEKLFTFLSPAFGAFMTTWMTLYLEHWKRVNARASLRWGTTDFEAVEQIRPQFIGEKIPSPIDGTPSRWFSPVKSFKRKVFSWIVIGFMILIVFGLVAAIFILHYILTKGDGADDVMITIGPIKNFSLGPMIAAFANVAQITLMGKIYGFVSIYLNNQENHRTDVEYENSLIIKTVIFQFVNNYSCLFYVAFMKASAEGCSHSCMWELQYTYATVYLSRLITSNVSEVAIPRFWVYFNQFRLTGTVNVSVSASATSSEEHKSHAEKELFMSPYDWRGTFDDYTELVIQFGFTTMFVVSFPLAPLLSYLVNFVEIRMDAYRLIFESRRPRPQQVKDMGYWFQVLQAFAAISICTNGGVVIFTGNYFNGISTTMRVWFFTLFISAMFFFKYILEAVIDDTPRGVRAQQRRQEFLVGKCLYHVPDEDDTKPPSALQTDLDNPGVALFIHETDN